MYLKQFQSPTVLQQMYCTGWATSVQQLTLHCLWDSPCLVLSITLMAAVSSGRFLGILYMTCPISLTCKSWVLLCLCACNCVLKYCILSGSYFMLLCFSSDFVSCSVTWNPKKNMFVKSWPEILSIKLFRDVRKILLLLESMLVFVILFDAG